MLDREPGNTLPRFGATLESRFDGNSFQHRSSARIRRLGLAAGEARVGF